MQTRSPLKRPPLRNPGESVDRELLDLLLAGVFVYCVIAIFMVAMALAEWYRWSVNAPPNPLLLSAIAAAAVSVAVWQFWRYKPRIHALKLGRDGEKVVGQFLEQLRESGARVFHDVPGEGFNIDHVIIDRTGIYAIETKTLSKPMRGRPMLFFDGQTVRKGALEPDRNPIFQARAARQWLAELLQESTGKVARMRAVVLYPGWYVEAVGEGKSSDIWVLEPKALPKYISNASQCMSPEDVSLFAFHLSRYIRSVAST